MIAGKTSLLASVYQISLKLSQPEKGRFFGNLLILKSSSNRDVLTISRYTKVTPSCFLVSKLNFQGGNDEFDENFSLISCGTGLWPFIGLNSRDSKVGAEPPVDVRFGWYCHGFTILLSNHTSMFIQLLSVHPCYYIYVYVPSIHTYKRSRSLIVVPKNKRPRLAPKQFNETSGTSPVSVRVCVSIWHFGYRNCVQRVTVTLCIEPWARIGQQ